MFSLKTKFFQNIGSEYSCTEKKSRYVIPSPTPQHEDKVSTLFSEDY